MVEMLTTSSSPSSTLGTENEDKEDADDGDNICDEEDRDNHVVKLSAKRRLIRTDQVLSRAGGTPSDIIKHEMT